MVALDNENRLIVIKGAGDLAAGVAHRLFRNGLAVTAAERDFRPCFPSLTSF